MLFGSVGYITLIFKGLPVSSTTASLHPVLNPGSYPKTTCPFIGGVKRSFSKLLEKFSIALSSATLVKSLLISLSILGLINLS